MSRRARQARPAGSGQVMTVDQVAGYLQLNRLTVYRYIREGRLPAAKIGKLYRVLKEDVDQFLEAQKAGAVPGRAAVSSPTRERAATPPRATARPRFADEAYVGPQWREQLKDREEHEQASLRGNYPLEWVMRGLH